MIKASRARKSQHAGAAVESDRMRRANFVLGARIVGA
jgi:hypothetical protein